MRSESGKRMRGLFGYWFLSVFIGKYVNFTGKKAALLYETWIFSIRIRHATADMRLGW